jgi:hypothetical protein
MKTLVHKLLMCRVRPYYIYQCDLINGSSPCGHRGEGVEIIEGLRGHTPLHCAPIRHRRARRRRQVPIIGYVLYRQRKNRDRNYEAKLRYPKPGTRTFNSPHGKCTTSISTRSAFPPPAARFTTEEARRAMLHALLHPVFFFSQLLLKFTLAY